MLTRPSVISAAGQFSSGFGLSLLPIPVSHTSSLFPVHMSSSGEFPSGGQGEPRPFGLEFRALLPQVPVSQQPARQSRQQGDGNSADGWQSSNINFSFLTTVL